MLLSVHRKYKANVYNVHRSLAYKTVTIMVNICINVVADANMIADLVNSLVFIMQIPKWCSIFNYLEIRDSDKQNKNMWAVNPGSYIEHVSNVYI